MNFTICREEKNIDHKHHRRNTSNDISRNQPVASTLKNQKAKSSDLVFEDIDDDLDQELGHLTLGLEESYIWKCQVKLYTRMEKSKLFIL